MQKATKLIYGRFIFWPKLAPMQWMTLCIFVALLEWICAAHWHLKQPYFQLPSMEYLLGKQLIFGNHSHPEQANPSASVTLTSKLTRREPDQFASFHELNLYLQQQYSLHQQFLHTDTITLTDHDNQRIQIFSKRPKNILDLPLNFWIYQTLGTAALLMGCAFWAFHPSNPSMQCILLAAIGFAMLEWSMAFYSCRELTINGNVFKLLLLVNHGGGILFAVALIAVLCFYPNRVVPQYFLVFYRFSAGFIFINEIMQWINWPIHLFYFPTLPLFGFFVYLILRQWFKCSSDKLKKRALKSLGIWVLLSLGSAFTLYVIPTTLQKTHATPLVLVNLLAYSVFIGFIVGVHKQYLFGIQRWWIRSWAVSGILVALTITDFCLASLLNFGAKTSWSAISIAGLWLYLPIRHWITKKFTLAQPSDASTDIVLNNLLETFKPLEFQQLVECNYPPENHGITLTIPINNRETWLFTGKNRGFSLFTNNDKHMVLTLLQQDRCAKSIFSHTQVRQERERIMRDLHDDITADLLSLTYPGEPEFQKDLARDTLIKLRAIVYSLQTGELQSLHNHLLFWQEDFLRLCRNYRVDGHWKQLGPVPSGYLKPAAALNIYRIMREGVSNGIKHANPNFMQLKIACTHHQIRFSLIDNGHHSAIRSWQRGKGIRNIEKRVQELKGTVTWALSPTQNGEICRLQWSVPIAAMLENHTYGIKLYDHRETAVT